jgi:DNA polymerase III epsilon subunit-like protein
MGLDFCAIDFETANSERGSPCAVGLIRVEGGYEVAARRWLMRPPEPVEHFDAFNVRLHGIDASQVDGEPRFAERLPDILEFGIGLPFVAHNAAFDMGVIREACRWSDLDEWPPLTYFCTLAVSRRTWPDLPSYSLPWAVDAAGGSLRDHHEPLSDARAAAEVLIASAKHFSARSVEDLADKANLLLGSMDGVEWSGSVARQVSQASPGTNEDADPSHPFYDREVAFTGALFSMKRADAQAWVAVLGGQPGANVTKTTNILVTGYQDPGQLTHGLALSRKVQKAADLKAKGQEIEIVPEDDFVRMLRT